MKLTRLGIFTVTLLSLVACSEQVLEPASTKANRNTVASGKPSAPIHLSADIPKEVQLNEPISIQIQLRAPAGSTPRLQFTTDPGLELLDTAREQIQLLANDTGAYELSIDLLPTSIERLYMRVFVQAAGKARSFSLPVAVAGAFAKSEAQRRVNAEASGENIIVLPSEER